MPKGGGFLIALPRPSPPRHDVQCEDARRPSETMNRLGTKEGGGVVLCSSGVVVMWLTMFSRAVLSNAGVYLNGRLMRAVCTDSDAVPDLIFWFHSLDGRRRLDVLRDCCRITWLDLNVHPRRDPSRCKLNHGGEFLRIARVQASAGGLHEAKCRDVLLLRQAPRPAGDGVGTLRRVAASGDGGGGGMRLSGVLLSRACHAVLLERSKISRPSPIRCVARRNSLPTSWVLGDAVCQHGVDVALTGHHADNELQYVPPTLVSVL